MRTVAVVMGGASSEHEVSLSSGREAYKALDRRRYRPVDVVIERDGCWRVDGIRRGGALEGAAALRDLGCEIALLMLHGTNGEDGAIQGFFETAGIPYTGSGVGGSALAWDKIAAKRLAATAGIEVARDLVLPPATADDVPRTLGFPVFVKDPCGGSSLEVRPARDADELRRVIAGLGGRRLLVEAAVKGRELTVPILDDGDGVPQPLPVIEIRSKGGFFDYENKYTPGVAEEIVPAPVPPPVSRRVEEAALRVHRLLGLHAMSRSDFILKDDGTPVFLEVNTIPGMTPNSLLPKAAAAAGIAFPEVLARLLESAGPRATMDRVWNASSGRSGGRSTGSSTAPTAGRSSS
ncbi:MAG TPA: D-alanine--D-alanine ligase [Planctomycetota bacterium]|nr:D-alanine--D-alanine ligase [Planctomycetota bacterium]